MVHLTPTVLPLTHTHKPSPNLPSPTETTKESANSHRVVIMSLAETIQDWRHVFDKFDARAEEKKNWKRKWPRRCATQRIVGRSGLREPSEKRCEVVVPEAWKATKSSESRRLNEVMNIEGLRRLLEKSG